MLSEERAGLILKIEKYHQDFRTVPGIRITYLYNQVEQIRMYIDRRGNTMLELIHL